MPDSSRIGAAQDGLKAALDARNILDENGNKTPLDLGYPVGGPQAPEHIWIDGGVEEWNQEWEVTGPTATSDREETFELAVKVLVTRKDTWTAARDRALALVREIELAARTDEGTLANTVFECDFTGRDFDEWLDADERRAGATVRIRCRAYLSG